MKLVLHVRRALVTGSSSGIGEAITKAGRQELIVSHVPLAMLIFGLGIYLSIAGARLRRAAT